QYTHPTVTHTLSLHDALPILMSDQSDYQAAVKAIDNDEAIPTGMYPGPKNAGPSRDKMEKPTHYKVICISMYTKDLQRLDEMVRSEEHTSELQSGENLVCRLL